MCTWPRPGSMNTWPAEYVLPAQCGSSPSYNVNEPALTTTTAGPGCVCHPVVPPGAIVTCCTTTSLRWWRTLSLTWPSSVPRARTALAVPEPGVASADPAAVAASASINAATFQSPVAHGSSCFFFELSPTPNRPSAASSQPGAARPGGSDASGLGG